MKGVEGMRSTSLPSPNEETNSIPDTDIPRSSSTPSLELLFSMLSGGSNELLHRIRAVVCYQAVVRDKRDKSGNRERLYLVCGVRAGIASQIPSSSLSCGYALLFYEWPCRCGSVADCRHFDAKTTVTIKHSRRAIPSGFAFASDKSFDI